ncbi:hypothetical protein [Haloplanus salilacus]|uniref:hypothetical protein n=1 Tax=Haloplanus salilacus TaxID=2949994 RepID=UPI0030D42C53
MLGLWGVAGVGLIDAFARPWVRAAVGRLPLPDPDAVDRLGGVVDDDGLAGFGGKSVTKPPLEIRRGGRRQRRDVVARSDSV